MKINTANFGKIDIDESKIIEFQDGIPGFEDKKKFTVILNEDMDNPFHYLQSVENEDLSFVIINPFDIFPEYEFNIPKVSKEKLHIENEKQVIVYTIVVVPEDIEKMTTNLQGPIIIIDILQSTHYSIKVLKRGRYNMLILTRKKDESIIIDGNIEVKIVECEDGKVKIGIEAPRNIEILRKELYDQIENENKSAASKNVNLKDMKNLFKK